MRKLMVTLFFLAAFFAGCSFTANQPAPKPQTIVVPEVSNIPFKLVELKDAPAVVEKVTMTMEDREFINWLGYKDKGYIIIVPDNKNSSNAITIDRIEQRVPDKNYSWLNVKLKYSAGTQSDSKPVIAQFNLKSTPNAVGFQLDRLDLLPAAQKSEMVEQKPVPRARDDDMEGTATEDKDKDYIKGPAIRVLEPRPGDGVTSPLVLKGEVGFLNGDVRVRLKDSSGKILAEKPVAVEQSKIETTIPFVTSSQQQGVVEVFLFNPQDNTEVSRVAVYVTLLTRKE